MFDYIGLQLRKAWCPTTCPRCGAKTELKPIKGDWQHKWSWSCYWTVTHALDDYLHRPDVQAGIQNALLERNSLLDRLAKRTDRWQGGTFIVPFRGSR